MTSRHGTATFAASLAEEHVNKRVIKADAYGCLTGGIRGAWVGGPQGALSGCFVGGLIGSGSVIWNHLM
jgi:hypothetical protein